MGLYIDSKEWPFPRHLNELESLGLLISCIPGLVLV